MKQSSKIELCEDLENWMSNLPRRIKTVPINLLAIPGSHDSMTATITCLSKLPPDTKQNEVLVQLQSVFPCLMKKVTTGWGKTQDLDIKEQLYLGVRYFDLRIAPRNNSRYPYFVHGAHSSSVECMFKKLKTFLNSHSREVIILDFQHIMEFSRVDHLNFIKLIKSWFKHQLVPYDSDMDKITLNYMNSNSYQLILVYRDPIDADVSFLWPSSSFPTPWHNTLDKSQLFECLNKGVEERDLTIGYVSQCFLTPNTKFIMNNIRSGLKAHCSKPIQNDIIKWVQKQYRANIIICDFVDFENGLFCKEVVNRNNLFLSDSFTAGYRWDWPWMWGLIDIDLRSTS